MLSLNVDLGHREPLRRHRGPQRLISAVLCVSSAALCGRFFKLWPLKNII